MQFARNEVHDGFAADALTCPRSSDACDGSLPSPGSGPRREPALPGDVFERAQRVASGQLDSEDVRWLRKGFSAFLAGGGAVALERCLRLPRHDGALRRACRDHWLRSAWHLLRPGLSPWRRSELLADAVRAFAAGPWQQWQKLPDAPRHASDLDAALFRAFRAYSRMPLSAMQLHNIAHQRQHS
jgi:hypothetical protein